MKIEEIAKALVDILGNQEEEPIIKLSYDIQIEIKNVSVGNYILLIRIL